MITSLVGHRKITNHDNGEEGIIWYWYSNNVRYADSLLPRCIPVYINLGLAV